MDERLEKALDFSNYMFYLNNSKKVLEENFYQDIVYYYNGAQFTINKELICFCSFLNQREQDSIVLVDDNNRPIEIADLAEFEAEILDLYMTASNNYLSKYNALIRNRTIEKMVEL